MGEIKDIPGWSGGAIGACVFDAYGTLFDVAAAAEHCRADLGDKAGPLSELWRAKQVSYTWLRSLMGAYADFRQVTRDALDFAMAALDLEDALLAEKLMALYDRLDAYAEVPDMLGALKGAGMRTAILSNGSPGMLAAAVENAGIGGVLDAVLSVDGLKIYKPHPSVYRMAVDRLGVAAGEICFMSANAWDVAGAAHFGFRVVWINRFGQNAERLPGNAARELTDLSGLPALLGIGGETSRHGNSSKYP